MRTKMEAKLKTSTHLTFALGNYLIETEFTANLLCPLI